MFFPPVGHIKMMFMNQDEGFTRVNFVTCVFWPPRIQNHEKSMLLKSSRLWHLFHQSELTETLLMPVPNGNTLVYTPILVNVTTGREPGIIIIDSASYPIIPYHMKPQFPWSHPFQMFSLVLSTSSFITKDSLLSIFTISCWSCFIAFSSPLPLGLWCLSQPLPHCHRLLSNTEMSSC